MSSTTGQIDTPTPDAVQALKVTVQQLADQLKSYYCSLETRTSLSIPPSTWTPVRFDLESRDDDNWHPTSNLDDRDSALITPTVTKVGLMSAMAQFTSGTGDATQISLRFDRDPYGVQDTTATQDFDVTRGNEFRAALWPIILHAGQPLSFDVWHDASTAQDVNLGEFKVWCPAGSDM